MRREPPAEQLVRLHNAKFMDLQTFRRETERKIGVIVRKKKHAVLCSKGTNKHLSLNVSVNAEDANLSTSNFPQVSKGIIIEKENPDFVN